MIIMTYLIDAHQDIAFNALTFGRDIRLSALQTRESEKGSEIPLHNYGEACVGWPEFQVGNIAVVFGTLWTPPIKYSEGDWMVQAYQDTRQGSQNYHLQLDYYRRLCDENPKMFRFIQTKYDLAEVLAFYEDDQNSSSRPVGIVPLMEGADGLIEPEELQDFYELGLRQVGPVWAGNRYYSGSHETHPFDQEGRRLLEIMSSLGMALDISHMAEEAILTALDHFEGSVIASHANARRLMHDLHGERHLTDTVIRRVFERNGVIGVVPFNRFLNPEWTTSSPRQSVTLDHLAAQIDYYCQLAGDSRHTGIGTDFDGGFGYPSIPAEMETISDLQKIKPVLLKKGYTESDVANIFGLNWKKHLESILPE